MMGDGLETGLDPLSPVTWLLVAVMLCAASGPLAALFRGRPEVADRVGAATLVSGTLLGLAAAGRSAVTPAPTIDWAWLIPWGRFQVGIDGLSAAFLFPIFLVVGLAAIYGLGSWPGRAHVTTASRVRGFLGLLAASMALLVGARDAVLFLLAFEGMTLSIFFLVTTEHERREVREAGWIYLVASHVSFLLLLAVFSGARLVAGSFALEPIPGGSIGGLGKSALFLGALVAFGLKAGIMPLHVWLPGAHASAPSHVSAVLSAVVIKTGIYGLLRILMMLPDPPAFWGGLLIALGAVSGVVGVFYALGQHDLKRLLAYHSIENIGIIVMGAGLALIGVSMGQPLLVTLGFGAAVFHVWNHAIFKSLLFLSAGAVVHAAGTREIDRLGGLGRMLPWTAALFTVGAVAISGLPPFNGFASEFLLYTGALRGIAVPGAQGVTLIAPVLAVTGALACACFAKVVAIVFLGSPRYDERPVRECAWTMRAPMLVLAGLCGLLGLAPILVSGFLDTATTSWAGAFGTLPTVNSSAPFGTLPTVNSSTPFGTLPTVAASTPFGTLPTVAASTPFGAIAIPSVALFVVAVLVALALRRRARSAPSAGTWDCGYLRPTARMQYTGSSFARTLVGLSRHLVAVREELPAIRGPFPAPSVLRGHVDDLVLDRWILPLVRWCTEQGARIRDRQSAHVQSQIGYVGLATLGLLLLPLLDFLRKVLAR